MHAIIFPSFPGPVLFAFTHPRLYHTPSTVPTSFFIPSQTERTARWPAPVLRLVHGRKLPAAKLERYVWRVEAGEEVEIRVWWSQLESAGDRGVERGGSSRRGEDERRIDLWGRSSQSKAQGKGEDITENEHR